VGDTVVVVVFVVVVEAAAVLPSRDFVLLSAFDVSRPERPFVVAPRTSARKPSRMLMGSLLPRALPPPELP